MTFKTKLKTTIRQLVAVICVCTGITVVLADEKVFVEPLQDLHFVTQPTSNIHVFEGQSVLSPCSGSTFDSQTNWVRKNDLNIDSTYKRHQQLPVGAAGTGTASGPDSGSVPNPQRSPTYLPQSSPILRAPLLSSSSNARDLNNVENIPHSANTPSSRSNEPQYLPSNGPMVLRNGSLYISDSKPDHSGWYQCTISSNRQRLISNIIKITVTPYPVNSIPANLYPQHGSTIELQCLSKPHVPASYVWTKNAIELPLSHSLSFLPFGVLQLYNISDKDAGQYMCQTTWLNTGVNSTITTILHVTTPELGDKQTEQITWINIPQDTTVLAGNTVVLKCLAQTSNSIVNYSWSRKDGEALCSNNCTSKIINGNLYLFNTTLLDDAEYVCTVNILAQPFHKSAKVTFQSLPEISVSFKEINSNLAQNIAVTCTATGVPQTFVDWYRDGVKLKESEGKIKVRRHGKNLELKIIHFSVENRGKYQCFAQNKLGTAVQTVNFNFPAGEYYVGPQNVSIVKVDDTDVTLRWSAGVRPNSTFYLVLYQNSSGYFKHQAFQSECKKNWCSTTIKHLSPYTRYSISIQTYLPVINTIKPILSLETKPLIFRTDECIPSKQVNPATIKTYELCLKQTSVLLYWNPLPSSESCGRILYYKVMYGPANTDQSIEVRVTNEMKENQFVFTKLDNLIPDTFYAVQILAATRKGVVSLDSFESFEGYSFDTLKIGENKSCSADANNFVINAKFVNKALGITWDLNSPFLNMSFNVLLYDINNVILYNTSLTMKKTMLIENLDVTEMYGIRVLVYSNGDITCLNSTTAVFPGSYSNESLPEITFAETVGQHSIKVEWVYEPEWYSDQPVQYYIVRYTIQDQSSAPAQYINSTTTSLLLTGLKLYSKYEIVVKAVFKAGQVNEIRAMSPYSKGVSRRTKGAAPSGPPILKETGYASFILVSWTPPIKPNGKITQYIVKQDNQTTIKNSSDFYVNITCIKPGVNHFVSVAAVNKYGTGSFSMRTFLTPPREFKSSCPLDNIAAGNATTTLATVIISPTDNSIVLSVILGCSIVIFMIFLAVLMICCCCCTRRFDTIKCSWCKRSANNLKKCNSKQNGSRMYTNNRDSGICLSLDVPQNGVRPKQLDKRPLKNGSIFNGHVTEPLLSELNEVNQNGYHQTYLNGNGVNGVQHMNGYHHRPSITQNLKRSKSATLQKQADSVISILFNKEKGKLIKQGESKHAHQNGILLSVPIPRHMYDYLSPSKTTSELDSDPIEAGSSMSSSMNCSNQESPSTSNSKSLEKICEDEPLLEKTFPLSPPNGINKYHQHVFTPCHGDVNDHATNQKRPLGNGVRPLNSSTSSNTSDYSSESPNASDEKLFSGDFSSSPSKLVEEMTSLWSDKYGGFKIDV